MPNEEQKWHHLTSGLDRPIKERFHIPRAFDTKCTEIHDLKRTTRGTLESAKYSARSFRTHSKKRSSPRARFSFLRVFRVALKRFFRSHKAFSVGIFLFLCEGKPFSPSLRVDEETFSVSVIPAVYFVTANFIRVSKFLFVLLELAAASCSAQKPINQLSVSKATQEQAFLYYVFHTRWLWARDISRERGRRSEQETLFNLLAGCGNLSEARQPTPDRDWKEKSKNSSKKNGPGKLFSFVFFVCVLLLSRRFRFSFHLSWECLTVLGFFHSLTCKYRSKKA